MAETSLPLRVQMRLLTWSTQSSPDEACGVICGTRANPLPFRLPNHSTRPQTSYEVDPDELRLLVEAHGMPFAVWHSHPGGRREPSHEDMINHPVGWDMIIVVPGEVLEFSG